ncbi:polysaccharide deacetylase family protein [Streptomyces tubercidicus]|uniref:polysaccharide deacetylase family protein n=1 Tax=Streptomyces tubercidicus TaxID=47759 RepID=UPI0022B771BF|nr:polysaccharide deacetylase family protein [Streptomyces tubercidicus]WAU10065.1 polysaccharide deacetylase family protein [Streptomyces tubercidicus]
MLSRAAFFLINEYASRYPGTVETLRKTGPYVGNHTWSHPHLPQLSEQDMRTEITEGIPSTLLRPPYGDLGERETRVASELGYRMCTWTIDPLDWDGPGGLPDRVPDPCGGEGRPGGDKRGGSVHPLPGRAAGHHRRPPGEGYAFCRNTTATTRNIPARLSC